MAYSNHVVVYRDPTMVLGIVGALIAPDVLEVGFDLGAAALVGGTADFFLLVGQV